jgi:serine/threonine-protein phosphatase 2A regulatory subunit B''
VPNRRLLELHPTGLQLQMRCECTEWYEPYCAILYTYIFGVTNDSVPPPPPPFYQYLELDLDQNGMLSLSEFRHFTGGSLTEVFCRRLFEECHTYAGEMDFKAFLDFVLASENRALPQSQRYMFRLFDLTRSGFLSRTDVSFLMRAVLDKLVSEGHDRLDVDSVVDEVLDMVKPAVPSTGVTLRDLQLCKVGHILTLILSDSAGFWTYDNRESLMQAPPLFADVATEGERGGSPGSSPQAV